MNILKKINIHYSTYFFVLLYFITGYIKIIIIVYFIVLVHELGHILLSKLFNYDILSCTFYPFGGITRTNKLINSEIYKDLIISFGGILFQIGLALILIGLNNFALVSSNDLSLFLHYNQYIIIFNLLPIIPLDGYIIVNTFLNNYISYYSSLFYALFISVLTTILFAYFYPYNYIILGFLFYNMFYYYKNISFVFNKFLLERYINDLCYKKIKYYYNDNIHNIRRNCYSYFKYQDSFISEKKLLAKRFDFNESFW